ncbi:MAG: hypothetical protein RR233_08360 [Clostridiales bacterium]
MLGFIAKELAAIGIPYEFMQWTADIKYPYWVGEYIEAESLNEDGKEECSFILTGFTRGAFLTLEIQKEQIKDHFWNGIKSVEKGVGYAAFYVNAFSVPEDDPELKKIQVELKIMKWKVR